MAYSPPKLFFCLKYFGTIVYFDPVSIKNSSAKIKGMLFDFLVECDCLFVVAQDTFVTTLHTGFPSPQHYLYPVEEPFATFDI